MSSGECGAIRSRRPIHHLFVAHSFILHYLISKNMAKSVLVLGANGYIGLGAAAAFVRAGYLVTGLIRDAKNEKVYLKLLFPPYSLTSCCGRTALSL